MFRPVNLRKNRQIWEIIATFCFFSYLQYLGCPVSHTKSLEKSMLGKVDFWGQTIGLYEKSLKTGKYLYLKFCASWSTSALTPTNFDALLDII